MRLRQRYDALSWEHKILLQAVLVSLIPFGLYFSFADSESSVAPVLEGVPQVDTMIPRGFVLVPVEIENYEALDSILGSFGLVDLYQGVAPAARLVARNVRLLRAPRNPSHFAVLVRETESDRFMQDAGAFTAIVKRPEAGGTEIVKAKKRTQRRIVYGGL